MRRLDYPSDYARMHDDLFAKGETDFRITEIEQTSKKIYHREGSSTIVRKYNVKLSFESATRTLKVRWAKAINGNFETWKHNMCGVDVPAIWDQVRHNVQHDCKVLEGEPT
tara:strand:+ start:1597 stop:1929 length:333 start_codon:yes stop_codon:yes gene_type:complete